MIIKVIRENGLNWLFLRSIYALKLRWLKLFPKSDVIFEKQTNVKKIDLFTFPKEAIEANLLEQNEDYKKQIISTANKAIEGEIMGFSSLDLKYGKPINWQLNPLTGAATNKNDKWFLIPDFDKTRGDIKITWEVSRFTYFYSFLQAYIVTKDKKYYNAFASQLSNWLEQNRYSYGANYKCGQEATLRMINTLIVYSGFKSYKMTSNEDDENVKKIVKYSYKKVLSNYFYAYHCIRNNHTISETIGLMIGAWSESNKRRMKNAIRKLNKVISYQFTDDGGYIQNSFNYQRFSLQLLGFIESNNTSINPHFTPENKDKIKKSINLLYINQDEYSGLLPNYGANDGALIFPLSNSDFRDYRNTLNSLNYIFKSELLYSENSLLEELAWFSNLPSIKENSNHKKKGISVYKESGIYSFSNSFYKIMIVNKPYKTRPSHFDNLHLDLFVNGYNVFKDSGSYSYASDLGKKMRFVEAHNTIKLDNKQPMGFKPPFLVFNWVHNVKNELIDNHFIGEYKSRNGYKHKKTVYFKDRVLEVQDEVFGAGTLAKTQFITDFEPRITNNGFEVNVDEKTTVFVSTNHEVKIEQAFVSDYYYKKFI